MDLKENEILVLRTTDKLGRAHGGFQWPQSGMVEAPDWDGKPECGGGLHGLSKGVGDADYLDANGVAQVVRVNMEDGYLEFNGKCKFRRGEVIFYGDLREAANIIKAQYPDEPVVFCTATAGVGGAAIAGNYGAATAGDRGTATAGYRGTATAGNYGAATAGDRGTATAGYRGTATAGNCGAATAGDRGTATAGYRGTATAGDRGTATAGDRGTAITGDYGTAIAGYRGTATAGDDGTIVIKYWDGRSRLAVGYVGEDGIEPNVAYRLDDDHKFVKANH